MISYVDLKAEINTFCTYYLPSEIEYYKAGKIIHDTTWKTNFFEPYEISLINTPLFQRLRYINQMGFVNYVYPSARHSRFEHSLGVTILAGRMCDYSQKRNESLLSNNDIISIRISALLHDVGHCLFSHTSELVYSKWLKNFIKEEFPDDNIDPAPHEFLTYLILRSDAFRDFFSKLSLTYSLDLDLNDIALRIVGGVTDESDRFKTSFIHGPFDADKLDYFHRDSQFSGIPVQLDLDRLFYEIDITDISIMDPDITKCVNDLTVGISGVNCIEQIIFNKMLLYSTIYNHHKVQAIDCMFKGVFEYIIENGIKVNINGNNKEINSPIDFLYLVDHNLFSFANDSTDPRLKAMIKNIQNRRLLKRVLIISQSTVKDKETLSPLLSTEHNRVGRNVELREIAKKIHADSQATCHPSEIWIDIPKVPSFTETSTVNIRTTKNKVVPVLKPISKFYPYNQFKELYQMHKLNAHVYAPDYCLKEVASSAAKILKEELGIEFHEKAFVCND